MGNISLQENMHIIIYDWLIQYFVSLILILKMCEKFFDVIAIKCPWSHSIIQRWLILCYSLLNTGLKHSVKICIPQVVMKWKVLLSDINCYCKKCHWVVILVIIPLQMSRLSKHFCNTEAGHIPKQYQNQYLNSFPTNNKLTLSVYKQNEYNMCSQIYSFLQSLLGKGALKQE